MKNRLEIEYQKFDVTIVLLLVTTYINTQQFLYDILLQKSEKTGFCFFTCVNIIFSQVLCIKLPQKNTYLKRCMNMQKENYKIKIEYGELDLKNIILQLFEEYCANEILKKV